MEGQVKNLISPSGLLPEVDPIRSAYEMELWYTDTNAANTDGHESAGTVPEGYKFYVTTVSVQNLGAASVIDIYDAAAGDGLETNWKYSLDAAGTDTTVVTGPGGAPTLFVLETGAAIDASVCAADHDVKIKLTGLKVKA